MLYVVGDSNAVYTSGFLLAPVDTRLCRVGWTTSDVLRAVSRVDDLSDATAFFVFVGLNDEATGEHIAANVLQIVSVVRARRSSTHVPILVAPPFCVEGAASETACAHRRDAAARVARELAVDRSAGVSVVTDHVTKAMRAKRSVQTTKPGSLRVDPLHLNRTGYLQVANTINRATSSLPDATKRHSKPKKRMDV